MERQRHFLRLLTAQVRRFTAADINLAMTVAEQSGVAIQNATEYQRLREMLKDDMASTDSLNQP